MPVNVMYGKKNSYHVKVLTIFINRNMSLTNVARAKEEIKKLICKRFRYNESDIVIHDIYW